MSTGPLAGIRVIDLTTIYSGPICTSVLGDQGADIVKIESPDGDAMRRGNPRRGGIPGPFCMLNRNKRSMVLDIRTDAGRDILLRLVDEADVLVENFRPDVMDRLKVGWDVLHERNPRLVFASISGVGSTGPYASRRVYDAVIQGVSGVADLSTRDLGHPAIVNTLVCDKVTAMSTAQAISSALVARATTGEGQRVEVSMLDAALFFLWPDSMAAHTMLEDDATPAAVGSMSNMMKRTKDGFVAVMPVKRPEWAGAFRAYKLPNLLEEDRFHNVATKPEMMELFQQIQADAIAEFTTDELCERLEAEDVPFARINTRAQAVEDPQVVAMGALEEVEHPVAGKLRQPRPTAQFGSTPSSIWRHAPDLGEHTEEILAELGVAADDVAALQEDGVVNRRDI